MMQHPAILALLVSSLIISGMLLYAGRYGKQILEKWDLNSGSELQLNLERSTYLISTILSYALLFQILSLFLFIYTADDIHTLFTGAMCAAGTLNVNANGYPTLSLKIINCLLAGVWLIINYADTRGYDYPLIKAKYSLLTIMTLLLLLETLLQFGYFSQLKGDVITSCCGSLFSSDSRSIAGELAGLSHEIMRPLFFAAIVATLVSAGLFYRSGILNQDRNGYLFSVISTVTFVISVASLISFIGPYFYQLPTHHCPFCILQREYAYVGYLLYATLLGGAVAGIGVGCLMPLKSRASMKQVIPPLQRRLAVIAISLYLLFAIVVSCQMFFTDFRLG
jgi:hypothetical protein